jgi:transglutaminase-like putative cysteine protease
MEGMKLQVLHRTVFEYGGAVRDSVNTLHLEARRFPFQQTISSMIRVLPATRMRRFEDLFQNICHHFEIPGDHTRLEIESRLKVQNLILLLPEQSIEAEIKDLQDPATRERTWQYLHDSTYVMHHADLWKTAVDLTIDEPSIYGKALSIMRWIHETFRYQPGVTQVSTTIAQAYEFKAGVCQDFTHVMLGMCRSLGIPARYASGYLYNGPSDQLVGAQASHAWCEVYLPHVGWIGYDPTNNTLADDRYVKAAVGRDYEDVAPIKGAYRGTAQCLLSVHVQVDRIDVR